MKNLLLSSIIILLSVGSLKAEEVATDSQSSNEDTLKTDTLDVNSDSKTIPENFEVSLTDEENADAVTDDNPTTDEAGLDNDMTLMAPPRGGGGRGGGRGHGGGGGYHRGGGRGHGGGGGYHRGGGGYGGGGGYHRGGGGAYRGRGGHYYGGYRSRPGWYGDWRWNRTWRPGWAYRGVRYPRYYRYPSIPYNYYQCTAFDEYMNAFSAGGRTINEAAYNALYACGGSTFEYSGCYIPEGYCSRR